MTATTCKSPVQRRHLAEMGVIKVFFVVIFLFLYAATGCTVCIIEP